MDFRVKATQWNWETGDVTIHVAHKFLPGGFHLVAKEAELAAEAGGENYGNAAVLAVGQRLLDAHPVYGGTGAKLLAPERAA